MRLYDYDASGNCLKVRAAARLLGLDLELVPTDIFAGDTLTDDYARVNPMRTVPVLEPEPGRFVRESNAILLFLAEGTHLLPGGPLDRAEVHRWLFFERAFTPSVGALRFLLLTGREEHATTDLRETGEQLLGVLDGQLTDRPFLAGDALTVADLANWAYAHVAPDAGFTLGAATRAWIDRVEATPGLVNDLVPYPPNARAGTSRSIYD